MSSEISFEGKSFWVSNRVAKHLLSFAIKRGNEIASNDDENNIVNELSHWYNKEYWDGVDLELNLLFSERMTQDFWAKVFSTASLNDMVEENRLEKALEISKILYRDDIL